MAGVRGTMAANTIGLTSRVIKDQDGQCQGRLAEMSIVAKLSMVACSQGQQVHQ